MTETEDRTTKVLHATLGHIPAPTGSACWSTEVIKELALQYELDCLSLKSEDLSHIERFHGARLLRVPVSDGRFLDRVKTFQRALNRQLDSEEYGLCHFTSIWEGMVLSSRRKAQNFKLVYEVHSLPSIDFRIEHPDQARDVETSYSLKQQEEKCFAVSDLILAGSRPIKDHLINRGVPAKKVTIVTPSIDLEPFDRAPEKQSQAGTILYLGSLYPWQGVVSLLQALAEFPRHIRYRLAIVASRDGPGFHEVRGKIQMLGLSRSVEFVEPLPIESLPEVVTQASICVAPLANHEHNREAPQIPHKVLVYMASRKPVIAADQPALRGLIENGTTGMLYPPGDSSGLSGALQKLLHDGELASKLGNQGRLFLEEHHGLERSLSKLRSAYAQLLGEPEPASIGEAINTTQPVEKEKDPGSQFADDPDTQRIQPGAKAEGRLSRETAPVEIAPEQEERTLRASAPADTDPDRAQGADSPTDEPPGEEEMVFLPVNDEDTAPRQSPTDEDKWQVLEATDVNMTATTKAPQPKGQTAGVEAKTQTKRRRYLLGGPSYPVEDEELPEAPAGGKVDTDRKAVSVDNNALELISDDEVELVDSGDDGET